MSLQPENVRALEQLRLRLHQLSTSLNILKSDLVRQETLPTWDSLQTRAGLLAGDLQQLQTIFDSNRQFLTAAHAYPHASYPGHAHEPVIQQLLRKKAEPSVEDWIDDNTNPAKVAKWDDGLDTGLSDQEQKELWEFAKPTSRSMFAEFTQRGAFDFEYTLAEKDAGVDNVVTGLRRKLGKKLDDEDDDSEDEDEDEEMEDRMEEDVMPAAKPPSDPFGDVKGVDKSKSAIPIESWLKFMSVMALPGK
ncbi:hypothetical protein Q7P37_007563 [Cladosporium fusiforme]